MTGSAIETAGLAKRYGPVTALEDLTLRVETGEVFGFLGPNGAGKTTTIRSLLNLVAPTAGTATVLGSSVYGGDAFSRVEIGYLPGELVLWPRFSGEQTLVFLERLSGLPAVRRPELLDRLQFGSAELRRPIGTYSDGMKQKIGIIQALQCAPRLALLDEPTKGLDPIVQQAFYEILVDTAARGTTIFFSSHVLPEVERVCTRVAMLRGGRLMSVSDVAQLRDAMPRRVTATFGADVDTSAIANAGRVVSSSPRRIELLVERTRIVDVVNTLAALPLLDLLVEEPSLEDAFLERYR